MVDDDKWRDARDVVRVQSGEAITIHVASLVQWLRIEEPSAVWRQLGARVGRSEHSLGRCRVLLDAVLVAVGDDVRLLSHVGEIRLDPVRQSDAAEHSDIDRHAPDVGAVLRFLQTHLRHPLEGVVPEREHETVAFILHAATWAK